MLGHEADLRRCAARATPDVGAAPVANDPLGQAWRYLQAQAQGFNGAIWQPQVSWETPVSPGGFWRRLWRQVVGDPQLDASEAGPRAPWYPPYALGGAPVRGAGVQIDLGPMAGHGGLHFMPQRSAGPDMLLPSCLGAAQGADAPLQPAAPLDVGDYVPGFYGAPWTATLNQNLVALLNVYVPRQAALPVPSPQLQVYRHYDGKRQTPDFTATPVVSVTRGSTALLYRLLVNGPIKCIDIVVPSGGGTGTGYIYYPAHGRMFMATGMFTIQR